MTEPAPPNLQTLIRYWLGTDRITERLRVVT